MVITPTHQQQHMICYVYIARVSATSSEHETCRLTNPSDRHVPSLLGMIKIFMAAVMAVASLICSHMAQTADQDDDYGHYCSTAVVEGRTGHQSGTIDSAEDDVGSVRQQIDIFAVLGVLSASGA